jgi:transcriptional regulator with XRE-family HTH domain
VGTRFNLDGAEVRALCIKRRWTREQLAEIAGVSSRTIQRAKTAGCAAFETVRAVAGAFEKDFDQLLEPEACGTPGPQPLIRLRPAPVPLR